MSVRVVHIATADMTIRFLLLNQLLSLKEEGYDVCAVCSNGRWVPEIEAAGIPVKTIEMKRKMISPLADLAAFWRLFRHFRKEKFHIVHTHTSKAGVLGRLAARLAGIPVIVHTAHGFYFHENMPALKKKAFVLIEKTATIWADLLFSQSGEDTRTAVREGIASPDKVCELGNGIDLELFGIERVSQAYDLKQGKQDLVGNQDAFVVMMIAEMIPRKGHTYLLQAAIELKKYTDQIKVVMVGTGRLEQHLLRLTDELGLREQVIFLGFRKDIPFLLSLADVYVLPSLSEGMPRSIIEAMALQKPVIASNIRGSRELVGNGETGLLVPVRDSKALAEAILYLLQHEEKAKGMGWAGRKRAEELFDENKVFQRIKTEYQCLLRAKGVASTQMIEEAAG